MKFCKYFLLLLAAVASVTARAATEKIRIMSYNIPMGNILVTDGNGRNTWENRCAVIHQYLNDVAPDLLGMQEPVRQELCDILRGIPNYAMVGTARNDGKESGEYTAIIYRTDRFRVLDTGNYWLTETPDVHSRVEGSSHYRIATWAFMEDLHSGARFLYTNTHLSYDSEPVRMAQIKVIKQHMLDLNNKYGKNLPHFFTGDFNMKETEENYTYVLNWKLMLKDLWSSTRNHYHYSTGKNTPSGRIDYIYATRNVTSTYAQWDNRKTPDGFWMSDHDPLWADAQFVTSAADDARGAIVKAWKEVDSVYAYTNTRTRLVNLASQLSSDGMEAGYAMRNAIDLNSSTYIHSLYSKTPPSQPHYLQVELRDENVSNFRFTYYRRNDNVEYGQGDRWKDLMITASEDGENWNYICHVYNFGGDVARSYSSENIAMRKPYKYVRFHVLHTPAEHLRNGHPQYSVAEFQMYKNEVSSSCLYAKHTEVKEAADALTALIDEVGKQAEDGTVTRAQVQVLEEATEALRNARFTATSIECVPEQMASKSDMFDLNGRKVQTPQKGIYIMDGKKYLKK